jgi:hypothetical protein
LETTLAFFEIAPAALLVDAAASKVSAGTSAFLMN